VGHTNLLLEMSNIEKSFQGVKALKGVSLQVRRGTVHALMGENGAGKSTLMKILSGIYQPDAGKIKLNGTEIQIKDPKDAIDKGISMIHQELTPLMEMTIGENIFLGREPVFPFTRFVNYKKMYQDTERLLQSLNLNLNPRKKMKELSVAEMQMVEIIKAISYDSQIIIMDEPTSAITDREADKLFEVIFRLKAEQKGIIYISHKMDEIFRVSDDITVYRDGTHIGSAPARELDKDKLITMMVGKELSEVFPQKKEPEQSEVVLSVRGLKQKGRLHDISFDLKKGEVLGISGLMGSGRSETVEAIFGMSAIDEGEIFVEGKKVKIGSPIDAIKLGMAFVTEDRKQQGLFLNRSVKENISISSLDQRCKLGFIEKSKETSDVSAIIQSLKIKVHSENQVVETLSGGNQQKTVLGKWLLTQPKILIVDEPTRGIDIGAKSEIYKLMNELSKQGISIIMISSEMPEILGMSDRILVFREGKIAGELSRAEATQEKILALAIGHLQEE